MVSKKNDTSAGATVEARVRRSLQDDDKGIVSLAETLS
jgi:hypothetical protein